MPFSQGPEPGDEMSHGLDQGALEDYRFEFQSLNPDQCFLNRSRSVPYSNPEDPEEKKNFAPDEATSRENNYGTLPTMTLI